MSNESRAAFEAWWEDFKAEHDDWKYADSGALKWQTWQASRKVALEDAAKFIEDGSFLHDTSPAKLFANQLAPKIRNLG